MRVESSHDEGTWQAASAITLLQGSLRRSARRMQELQHNNGMHPTAKGVNSIRKD
jgi:hypothetical protein